MSTSKSIAIVGDCFTRVGLKTNQPISGNALQLLEAMLSALNIRQSEVFITNAIMEHVEAISKGKVDLNRESLYERLKNANVKVVLACGTWATYALTRNTKPIEELRGMLFWNVDIEAYVIPTYHPGAVAYKPTLFEDFSKDFQKIPLAQKMEPGGVPIPDVKLHILETEEQLLEALPHLKNPDDGVLAVDIETDGFDYWNEDILDIGFGPTENDVYVVSQPLINSPKVWKLLEEIFDTDSEIVFQNGKFDVQYLRAEPNSEYFTRKKNCIVRNARCDFDTMMAHYCLDERQGTHGLKTWATEEFLAPDWEKDIKKYLPTKDTPYSHIPNSVRWEYLKWDVYYTRRGRYLFKEKMIADDTLRCFEKVYVQAVQVFTELELEGIPIDVKRLKQLYEEAQPRIAEAAKKLDEAARDVGWDPKTYAAMKDAQKQKEYQAKVAQGIKANPPSKTEVPKMLNPKSAPQMQYVAYDLCGMPLFEGAKTCNKDAVDQYRHRHPFWKALAEYKEVADVFGTFIKGMLLRTDPDNKIRPDFVLHGTKTGRISCSNPNMQNLPRGSVVKDFFVADPDHYVVNVDYKTLEVVVAAVLSGDPEMQRPFIEGLDFHSETAKNVFHDDLELIQKAVEKRDKQTIIDYLEKTLMMEIRHRCHDLLDEGNFDECYHQMWSHMRFLTKFITFGIMYGRGAKSLAEGELNCSLVEANKYMTQFFNRYPIYNQWLKTQEKSALEKGYVQNVFGFKRRWPFITKDIMHEVRNQSWNTPIQGSASQLCMMALCNAHKRLKAEGIGRAMFTVHDSIVYSIHKKYLKKAFQIIEEEMTANILQSNVPLVVEFEVGPTYKKLSEVHFKDGTWQTDNKILQEDLDNAI